MEVAFRFVMTTDSTSVTVPPRKAETVVERTAALPSSPSLGRERARRREHPLPPRRQQEAGRDKWLTIGRRSSRALALLIFWAGMIPKSGHRFSHQDHARIKLSPDVDASQMPAA